MTELPPLLKKLGQCDQIGFRLDMEGIRIGGSSQAKPVPEREFPKLTKPIKSVFPEEPDLITVNSVHVGIFRLHDEKGRILCRAGDQVKKGTLLAHIETMNINNRVTAPVDGRIIEIAEEDGRPVEYGQILFVMI